MSNYSASAKSLASSTNAAHKRPFSQENGEISMVMFPQPGRPGVAKPKGYGWSRSGAWLIRTLVILGFLYFAHKMFLPDYKLPIPAAAQKYLTPAMPFLHALRLIDGLALAAGAFLAIITVLSPAMPAKPAKLGQAQMMMNQNAKTGALIRSLGLARILTWAAFLTMGIGFILAIMGGMHSQTAPALAVKVLSVSIALLFFGAIRRALVVVKRVRGVYGVMPMGGTPQMPAAGNNAAAVQQQLARIRAQQQGHQ